MAKFLYPSLLIVTMMSSTCLAVDYEKCRAEHFKDSKVESYDLVVKLSFLNTVTESNFEEHKKDVGGKGSILVKGIPLSAFGSYSEFDAARSAYFEETGFYKYIGQSDNIFHTYWTKEGANSYIACLSSQTGLIVYGYNEINNLSGIHFSYKPQANPKGFPSKYNVVAAIYRSNTDGAEQKNFKINPNGEAGFTIQRKSKEHIRVDVSVDGLAIKSVDLPYIPKAVTKSINVTHPVKNQFSHTINPESSSLDKFCISAPNNFTFSPDSVRIDTFDRVLGRKNTPIRCEGHRMITGNNREYCYEVWMSTWPAEKCSVTWELSADAVGVSEVVVLE